MTSPAAPVLVLGASSLIGRFLPARMAGSQLTGVGRGEAAEGYGRWVQWDLTTPFPLAEGGRAGDEGAGTTLRGGCGDVSPSRDHPPANAPAPTLPLGAGGSPGVVVSLAPVWLLPGALPSLIAAGAQRVVAVSSTSRWTKAASPDAGEREVARRLAEAEDAVVRLCAAAGVRWTLLRPTLIYAEGRDGNVSRLAALARRLGVLPISGAGAGRRQPVHADDLAAGIAAGLASPATHDRAYDLPGGETLTYAQMCRRVFEGMGRRPRLLHVPPPLWSAGLKLAAPWLPGATAAMGARMAADLVFDPAPAARDFGWAPRAFRPQFGPEFGPQFRPQFGPDVRQSP